MFKSLILIFLFSKVSLVDKRLLLILVWFDLTDLKYVSLEVIVWLTLSSIQSLDGECVLKTLCNKIECLNYIIWLGSTLSQFLCTFKEDSMGSRFIMLSKKREGGSVALCLNFK